MSDREIEERVRVRAHEIWEQQGRPDGRQNDHWSQARQEVDAKGADQDTPSEASGGSTGSAAAGAADENVTARHTTDPAEGDRETIERELSRTDGGAGANTAGQSGTPTA